MLLENLWPDEVPGYRCVAWTMEGKPGMRHGWFKTSAEAIRAAAALDRKPGVQSVYHACAIYDIAKVDQTQADDRTLTGREFSAKGRLAGNAAGAAALWLDVDIGGGPGKYATADEAVAGIGAFLPVFVRPSISVRSGGGIHLYWLLAEFVPAAQWVVLASRLKALCQQVGFLADPSRTSDLASVLRPPGALNRKYDPPQVVTERGAGAFHEVADIEALLPAAGPEALLAVPSLLAGLVDGGLGAAYAPAKWEPMTQKCQQLRQSHRDQGEFDSYPVWLNNLRTLARCEDADESVAMEFSYGHPSFEEHGVAVKWAEAKSMQPASCEDYARHRPEGCEECPYKGQIKSPIRLGEDKFNGVQTVDIPTCPVQVPQATIATALVSAPVQATAQFWVPVEDIRSGIRFQLTPSGDAIQFDSFVLDDGGKRVWANAWTTLTEVLYCPLRRESDPDTRRQVLIYALKHPKDPYCEVRIEAQELADPRALVKQLKALGIPVKATDKNHLMAHVSLNEQWFDTMQRQHADSEVYHRFGWVTNASDERAAFIGARVYKPGQQPSPVVRVKQAAASMHAAVKLRGEFAQWRAAFDHFNHPDTIQQVAVVCAGLGSVFAALTDLKESFAALSLYSSSGGQGKTTAARMALSVWGDPMFQQSGEGDTAKARQTAFTKRQNLPFLLDDANHLPPEVATTLVQHSANGVFGNRLRKTADNDFGIAEAEPFRLLLLLTSNVSLRQHFAHSMQGASHAVNSRMIELDVAGSRRLLREISANGDFTNDFADNYGHAGDMAMRYVLGCDDGVDKREAIKVEYRQVVEELRRAMPGYQNAHRFILATCAAAVLGVKIGNAAGVFTVDESRVRAYLLDQMYHQQRFALEEATANAEQLLGEFIAANTRGTVACITRRVYKTSKAGNVSEIKFDHLDYRDHRPPLQQSATLTGPYIRFEAFVDEMPGRKAGSIRGARALVDKAKLVAWLREKKLSLQRFEQSAAEQGLLMPYRGDTDEDEIQQARSALGAGWPIPGVRREVICLNGMHAAFSEFLNGLSRDTGQPVVPPVSSDALKSQ